MSYKSALKEIIFPISNSAFKTSYIVDILLFNSIRGSFTFSSTFSVNVYFVSPLYHPANVWPVFVGTSGSVALLPYSIFWASDNTDPSSSINVTSYLFNVDVYVVFMVFYSATHNIMFPFLLLCFHGFYYYFSKEDAEAQVT